jgi:thiamine pyrophosphate-dependent acetolactate synthase large subunit-like protein
MASKREGAAGDRMTVSAALRVLADRRLDEVVVTTMGATREWSRLSDSPLDFHYLPSAMGQAPMIALGLALADPGREVIVLNGDGSLLMSLGCLITIAAVRPRNLTVVVLENGVYEVTGGQRTAGEEAGVDFAAIARGAGLPTAACYGDLADWSRDAAGFFSAPAPRFVVLRVEPVREDYVPRLSVPFLERIARFRQDFGAAALGGGGEA